MPKQTKLIIIFSFLIAVLVAVGQLVIGKSWISEKLGIGENNSYKYQNEASVNIEPTPLPKPIIVEVDFGQNGQKITGESEGDNALKVLEYVAEKENLKVETEVYKFGSMVIAIGDKKNTDKEYWSYYVNDQAGQIASDYFGVYPGDKVIWRYTKSSQ
jgi:hypothetical protein